MKRYITLDENNIVVSERYGQTIADGEIENENGELGQVMQLDGSFVNNTLIHRCRKKAYCSTSYVKHIDRNENLMYGDEEKEKTF